MGYVLAGLALVVLLTGLGLLRVAGIELRAPGARALVYWVHVLAPIGVAWAFLNHRRRGRALRPGAAWTWATATAASVALTAAIDVRTSRPAVTADGAVSFAPSLARTTSGRTIPAAALMVDDYCAECHSDAHQTWLSSAHRFSSFNNKVYAASVKETREVMLARDGNVDGSRWCAGCHDPVPLFSGAFGRTDFDTENDPTSQAGLTCTACHAIEQVNSTRGNADFTIGEPRHYPFAFSESPTLRELSKQLIKAKPAFHKTTFLKPVHRTAEFCSSCHKVHIPGALNDYKEFLRGQNHYDSFILSGVSGRGARSFYYPPKAEARCAGCHMPLVTSRDFGAQPFDGSGALQIHDHRFLAANTGVAHLRGDTDTVKAQQAFLDNVVTLDIFGLREGGTISGRLIGPLGADAAALQPGQRYLVEIVLRTRKVGHHFTQGTADSNEVWVDVTATAGDRVIGRSGALEPDGRVDPWSHFVNVYMLDRQGRKVDRRNVQDIYVPLYDKQIPPGAAQVVHYAIAVPRDVTGPITLEARLLYRKFDPTMMRLTMGDTYRIDLPVTTIASGAADVAGRGRDPGRAATGVGALERLRNRPAARRQRRQREGRIASGRSGVRRGGTAGTARRPAQSRARVPQRRTAGGGRGGLEPGPCRRGGAVDRGVAHRARQQGERSPRRGDCELRGDARRHVSGPAGPWLRLQPGLRGAERARPGPVRAGQAGARTGPGRGPRRAVAPRPWPPSIARWPSTRRT